MTSSLAQSGLFFFFSSFEDESVENSLKFQTSLLELAEVQCAERVASQLGGNFEAHFSSKSNQEGKQENAKGVWKKKGGKKTNF